MSSIDSSTLNIYNGYSTIQQLNSGTYKEKSSRISSTIGDRLAISQTAYRKSKEASKTNENAEAVIAELEKYKSCRIRFDNEEIDLVSRLKKLASTKFNKFMSTVDGLSSSDPETVLKSLSELMGVENTEMQDAIKDMDYKEFKNLRKTLGKVTGVEDSKLKKTLEGIMKLENVKNAEVKIGNTTANTIANTAANNASNATEGAAGDDAPSGGTVDTVV